KIGHTGHLYRLSLKRWKEKEAVGVVSQLLASLPNPHETYITLVRIFSQLLATPNNGNGRKKPEKKEKGPEFSEFVGSDFIHPKDAVPIESIQEFDETVEGTGNKGRVCVVNDIVLGDIEEMMGIEEVEDTFRTLLQDRCNDADIEQQKIMDELELVVNGTQNIICDSGLISVSAGSGEEQNRAVEPMDYRFENDEFPHSDVKKCGNAGEMQVQGPLDQLPSENFNQCLGVELSTSAQEQTSALVTEEGELVGDFGVDCSSFGMPTADSFIPQTKIDEVQNPKSINMGKTKKEGLGKEIGRKLVTDMPINYVQNQVLHECILEEDSDKDHGNPAASEKVDVSCKKKRDPGSAEKKAKKKGDKCHFSHDTMPSTKSKSCSFFARHSCMKGDDCPFDHQLSKYPCVNFVPGVFCVRGCALCVSVEENFPKGSSHQPRKILLANTVQKQLKLASKGVSFVDVAKLSLPSPTTPKEGTTKVGLSSFDQSTSGTNQTLVEIPKKLPARIPKGINFLAFGKDHVCSFKSSINSLVNGEKSIDLLQNISFSLLDHTSSSLKDATKERVPQTVSSEISDKNQSVAESIKLSFPGKASMNDASTGLQGSSEVDNNESKPVQEARGASDSFQISAATASPFMIFRTATIQKGALVDCIVICSTKIAPNIKPVDAVGERILYTNTESNLEAS
ncbi:hypothetical protein HN51_027427, partial [Arachis hypogaea]